jgi:hypothetical protein
MIIQEISGYVLWILTVSMNIHSIDFANCLALIDMMNWISIVLFCPSVFDNFRLISLRRPQRKTTLRPDDPTKIRGVDPVTKLVVQRSKPWLVSWVEGVLFYPIL